MNDLSLPFDLSAAELSRHERWLRGLVRSLVRGAAADDVVQQTWLAALQSGPARPGALRAWLARVAKGFALRELRGDARRRHREAAAARTGAEPSAAETVERLATLRGVAEAVLELPEPYRTTIVLRYLHELPAAVVAERTGAQEATVRKRVERGLELMRERMGARHGPEWRSTCVALAASPAARLGVVLGGALMLKKVLVVAAAVLLVMLGASRWLTPGEPLAPGPGASQLASVARAAGSAMPASLPVREPVRVELPAAVESPMAPPGPGKLRVRVVWADDLRPAAAIPINAYELARVQRYDAPQTATTDAEGVARFASVLPGDVLVVPEAGSRRRVRVAPDQEGSVDLAVERGFDVAGVVVDPVGGPVAGAQVLVSDVVKTLCARPAATTNERGEFLLRSVGDHRSISARCDRYAPAPKVDLQGASGARLSVRLALGANAGSIHGTVLDAAGRPVVGACVRNGPHVIAACWEPEVVTDAAGAFRLAGIAAGKARLEVRAAGLVAATSTVEVIAAQVASVVVRLEAGATVRGTVRTSDNQPVPGACISASKDRWLGASTWTAADGTFELGGIATGQVRLDLESEGFGRTSTALALGPSAAARWDPVLDAGRVVGGKLLDDRGRPVPGWYVALSKQSAPVEAMGDLVETAVDGTFRFVNVPDSELRLRATPVQGRTWFRPALRERVAPGAQEVELRIEGGMPSARIKGVVLDDRGLPCGAASVLVSEKTCTTLGDGRVDVDAATGRFALGPFPPGNWTLRVTAAGRSRLRLPVAPGDVVIGPRELGPYEVWDVGIVRLPPR